MRNLRGNLSLFQQLSTPTISVHLSMLACESSGINQSFVVRQEAGRVADPDIQGLHLLFGRHIPNNDRPEAEATRNFHLNLVRWFFIYGILVIATGAGLLLWAGSVFI